MFVDVQSGRAGQREIAFGEGVFSEKHVARSALADCLWLGGTNVEAGAGGLSYQRDGRRGSVPC